MEDSSYFGLRFYEITFLLALGCLPYVVFSSQIGIFFLLLCVFFYCYQQIKRRVIQNVAVTGQAVVITGCDSGFGLELAKRLESLGFTVYAGCLFSNGEGAKSLEAIHSKRLFVVPLDVTSDESVSQCLKFVEESSADGVWALVNNAGIDMFGMVEFSTMDMYKAVAEVNLFGPVRVTKAFLPLIRKVKGRVVNVTSVNGRFPVPMRSAYGMTKYGCECFSDILRQEMKRFGVRVSIIEPGHFGRVTEMLQKQIEFLKTSVDKMWVQASDDVRKTYGEEYLGYLLTNTINEQNTSSETMDPVLDAMENAIRSKNPKYRYLVPGGNGFCDIYAIVAALNSYLPEFLIDYFIEQTMIKKWPLPEALKTPTLN